MSLAALGKRKRPPIVFEPPFELPIYEPPVYEPPVVDDPILIDDPVLSNPPDSLASEPVSPTPESLYYLAHHDAASPYGGWGSTMATAVEPVVSYETAFPARRPSIAAVAAVGVVVFGLALAVRSWRNR